VDRGYFNYPSNTIIMTNTSFISPRTSIERNWLALVGLAVATAMLIAFALLAAPARAESQGGNMGDTNDGAYVNNISAGAQSLGAIVNVRLNNLEEFLSERLAASSHW
jgi:hypothetical protein